MFSNSIDIVNDKAFIERLTSFSNIIIKMATEHNLDKLFVLILKELRSFTNADAGSLYIKEGNNLIFKVAQNDTLEAKEDTNLIFQNQLKSFILPIDNKSLAGLSAFKKEVFNIEDVKNSKYHDPKMDKKFNYSLSSMLVIPMLNHSGEVVGVLQLMNAKNERMIFDKLLIPQIEALSNQAAVLLDNLRLYNELDRLFESLVHYSIKAIDARDPCTAGHSERVAQYAVDVAKKLGGFTLTELKELSYSGLFHDIGKIGVREDVLVKRNKLSDSQLETIRERFTCIKQSFYIAFEKNKLTVGEFNQIINETDNELRFIENINIPGFLSDSDWERLDSISTKTFLTPDGNKKNYLTDFEFLNLSVKNGNLTEKERSNIESHVLQTYQILSQIPFPQSLSNVPYFASMHHEKLDGSGYPYGYKENNLPIQARILAVVDVFDALVSQDRPYKTAMPIEKAFKILDEEVTLNHFDSNVITALKQVIVDRNRK